MPSSTIFLIVVTIPVAAYFNWKQLLPDDPEPKDPDGQVLDQLRRLSSNLGKPHTIEFFLYFPTQQAADTVRELLTRKGFSAEVSKAAAGSDWLCLAVKEMLPKHSDLVILRTELSGLAEEFGGNYDGWGTPVVQ